MSATKTEPRAYRKEWIGEHYPLETPYGVVTIQPLGWGIRVESRRESTYVDGELVHFEDPPLRINGRDGRLGWTDFPIDREGTLHEPKHPTGGDLTPKQEAKLREVLPALVAAWLAEHEAEFQATREAYRSNRAQTCEESIRELEDALDVYRARLKAIEAGDMEVSPYLNGGRRLEVGE